MRQNNFKKPRNNCQKKWEAFNCRSNIMFTSKHRAFSYFNIIQIMLMLRIHEISVNFFCCSPAPIKNNNNKFFLISYRCCCCLRSDLQMTLVCLATAAKKSCLWLIFLTFFVFHSLCYLVSCNLTLREHESRRSGILLYITSHRNKKNPLTKCEWYRRNDTKL